MSFDYAGWLERSLETACNGHCWDCTLACASEDTDDLEARDGDRIELP